MRKTLLAISLMSATLWSCQEAEINTAVKVSGELKNFPKTTQLDNYSPEGYLLKDKQLLELDENNRFEITFDMEEPAYYRMGRNFIYLEPGDSLEMFCDLNDPNAAVFRGSAAPEANYLKQKAFPKSGSYCFPDLAKAELSLDDVRKGLKELVSGHEARLMALEGISEAFKNIEKARLQFDAANTLLSFSFYGGYHRKIPKEEMQAFADSTNAYFKEDIDAYLNVEGKPEYLQIDTFLGMAEEIEKRHGADRVHPQVKEYFKVMELTRKLSFEGPVETTFAFKDEVEQGLTTPEYKEIVATAFKPYDALMPGQQAPELTFFDPKDAAVNLSSFRGKVLVIDVWATWCGPCKVESPYYEALAKKYEGDDIAFISLSVDSNKKAWKKYITEHEKHSAQFVIDRAKTSKYRIDGVPRFMVIDAEGNFVDGFAANPSNEAFEATIQKAISRG